MGDWVHQKKKPERSDIHPLIHPSIHSTSSIEVSSMRIAIIACRNRGRHAVDAVTGRQDQPGAFRPPRLAPRRVVPFHDGGGPPRGHPPAKKHTYARWSSWDIGGLFTGEKPSAEAVAAMREADALVKVVRAFASDAVPHRRARWSPGATWRRLMRPVCDRPRHHRAADRDAPPRRQAPHAQAGGGEAEWRSSSAAGRKLDKVGASTAWS